MRCDVRAQRKCLSWEGGVANDLREWPTAEGEVRPQQPNGLSDLFEPKGATSIVPIRTTP